ncbi:GNAT family N-acetyltransferase [Burkholderia sp. BCC1988]|uniref:GNAT family N-acetyltransferase n=1 Tax=Burkholderia sp. BCC1988 TaxID=2817443 RepID=UPI002AB07505|nr:GNAT family N-acetyltransferase [Burkholderia sp. BCC1988]
MKARIAVAADMDVVSQTLGAGFFYDPVISFGFPDLQRRTAALPGFFRIYADLAFERGTVWMLGDGAAAALTFPSDVLDLTDDEMAKIDGRLMDVCGQDYETTRAFLDGLSETHPHGPFHQYTLFIAARPEYHGKGVGAKLVNHLHDTWSRQGTPAYLEASSPRSRLFYLRNGYHDGGPAIQVPGCPELYPMWWNLKDAPVKSMGALDSVRATSLTVEPKAECATADTAPSTE